MLKIGEKLFDLSYLGELKKGKFIKRINRFVGMVDVKGKSYLCHIADTGRLEEILTKGRDILLAKNPDNLKTDFKLLACKMEHWVLINTSIHSKITDIAIKKGVLGFVPENIKREVKVGNSRLDFLIDGIYAELKGSNLLKNGRCLFPDAPTIRGVRHIKELIRLRASGIKSALIVMALRDCHYFKPNDRLDPLFSRVFNEAMEVGVIFWGYKVKVDGNFVVYNGELNREA